VPINRVQEFQDSFLRYAETTSAGLREGLAQKKELTEDLENQLKNALNDFKQKAWKK
jgi:F0F1-type ATP synthase alpha subunit